MKHWWPIEPGSELAYWRDSEFAEIQAFMGLICLSPAFYGTRSWRICEYFFSARGSFAPEPGMAIDHSPL